MANPNCSQILASYGDWLSNNPDADFPRPHPLFFSGTNCSGQMWPRFEDVPVEEILQETPFQPKFGSMYVPAYWEVVLYNTDIKSVTRTICSSYQPTLIADTKSYNFNCLVAAPDGGCPIDCSSDVYPLPTGGGTKDNVVRVSMQSIVPVSQQVYSTECWAFDMCNSYITTNLGAQNLTSFSQGSLECDDTMTGFCGATTGYTCRLNHQAGNNLQLPECSCLTDEADINEAFCQPGNTVKECQDAGAFQGFIPVTCFGKNCSAQGYRFGRMLNQQCNVTLCQQVIDVIGNDITTNAVSVLYCGTKPVDVTPTVTPAVSSVPPAPLPDWAWLLIVSLLMVFLVLVPLAFFIHKRAAENQKEDDLRKQSIEVSLS